MALPISKYYSHFNSSKSKKNFISKVKSDGDYDPSIDTDVRISDFYDAFRGAKDDVDSKTERDNIFEFTQEIQRRTLSDDFKNSREFITPDYALNVVYDDAKDKFRDLSGMYDQLVKGLQEQIYLQLEQQYELHRKINQETSLTGTLSRDWRNEIMMAYPSLLRVGISFSEVEKSMVSLIKDAGRFKLVNEDTIELIGKTSKVFFDSMEDGVASISQYQKVSKGASDAMESIKDIGLESLSLGLNAKETVKTLTENISKLNQFGFKNGEKGLARMIKQSQELKMSMQSAFDIAEKVMDPTSALELAANIQVIGGSINSFMDPLKLMYMATNDAEGLQQAIVDVADSLVSFDEESKTFKIMGSDLRRARALAKEMNISLEELTNTGIQSAQRTTAAMDLMSSGLQIDDDEKEFLTNIAQMKGGKMVIEVPKGLRDSIEVNNQGLVELDKMSQSQLDNLMKYREDIINLSKDKSLDDLTREQVGLVESMSRDVSFLAATARVQGGIEVQKLAEQMGYTDESWKKKIADTVTVAADGIKYFTDEGGRVVRSAVDMIDSAFKEKGIGGPKETTQQNTVPQYLNPQTQVIKYEYTFKSDVPSDIWGREMIKQINESKDTRKFVNTTAPSQNK